MNEMLANQLFMARKYVEALPLLEEKLSKENSNKLIKRKLVICYAQVGELRKGSELFYQLIQEDIQFIIDADPIHDDCPCPEIVAKFEDNNPIEEENIDSLIYLGILMLFCDYKHSLSLFEKAKKLSPDDSLISNIYEAIKKYVPLLK